MTTPGFDTLTALLLLATAGFPALLYFRNIRLYRPPPTPNDVAIPAISLLIPARNEAAGIESCLEAAAQSEGIDLEIIVLDDDSNDSTARLVESFAQRDPRVRLSRSPRLPEGWCGKQHACHVLAGRSSRPLLAFIDADVRLEPHGLSRAAAFLERSGADLVSGVPHQRTESFQERLLIPLIHFVLLSYLPLDRMRASIQPALGAGCGQFFLTWREAYCQAGGHAAIRNSMHDGIMLPRAFRRAGLRTDLFDADEVADCRMYQSHAEVWRGLAKNATEGMAAPAAIIPWSILLLGGQVLPTLILLAVALDWIAGQGRFTSPRLLASAGVAALVGFAVRLDACRRFRQNWFSVALHPLGVAILMVIQWQALLNRLRGRSASWRGRTYPRFAEAEPVAAANAQPPICPPG